jgi:hypothetical protein
MELTWELFRRLLVDGNDFIMPLRSDWALRRPTTFGARHRRIGAHLGRASRVPRLLRPEARDPAVRAQDVRVGPRRLRKVAERALLRKRAPDGKRDVEIWKAIHPDHTA